MPISRYPTWTRRVIVALALAPVACTTQTAERIDAVAGHAASESPRDFLALPFDAAIKPDAQPTRRIDAGNYDSALAAMYLTGKGVPQDRALAFRLYGVGAAQGNADALNHLAMLYVLGESVFQDDAMAVLLFRRAIDAGSVDAINNLAWMTEQGRVADADRAKARDLYEQAAEQGNAEAKANLRRLDQAAN
jgi:TPR repeat protein